VYIYYIYILKCRLCGPLAPCGGRGIGGAEELRHRLLKNRDEQRLAFVVGTQRSPGGVDGL